MQGKPRSLFSLFLILGTALTWQALASHTIPNDSFEQSIAKGHSHNDYEQAHPLGDALANRIPSVEVDVWHRSGDLWISHIGLNWSWKGVLKDLYLDPLQKLVNERGSVHGDGKPFYLWLDIKGYSGGVVREIRKQLSDYPMLWMHTPQGAFQRPVSVIFTGDEAPGREYLKTCWKCRGTLSTETYSPADPEGTSAWGWYALNWKKYVKWDGRYPVPSETEQRLTRLVAEIHAKKRKVRFWNVPATYPAWKIALNAGVDLISTDHLSQFNWFAHDPQSF